MGEKLTAAQREVLEALGPDWRLESDLRKSLNRGVRGRAGGFSNTLVSLARLGLIEMDVPYREWRLTESGRALLGEKK